MVLIVVGTYEDGVYIIPIGCLRDKPMFHILINPMYLEKYAY